MLDVGLTGGIGSGKSTVAQLLQELGATVIDADVVAREVVEPGTPTLAAVAERFGRDLVRQDGSLDRAGLAAIVFPDPS
ncbi:MAG TPA: dephospho-CoA kinase, partial [Lapillicoccus sp.]